MDDIVLVFMRKLKEELDKDHWGDIDPYWLTFDTDDVDHSDEDYRSWESLYLSIKASLEEIGVET